MAHRKNKKAEGLRETTPQDILFGFNTLAESITKELNKFAYRQDDPEVKRLYNLYRPSIDTFQKLHQDVSNLPELIGNDFYSGLTRLKEFCERLAKKQNLTPKLQEKAKELSKEVVMAYQLYGVLDTQTEVAEKMNDELERTDITQSKVSRWITKYKKWLDRVGLPDVIKESDIKATTTPRDPKFFEMGRRTDGLSERQREKCEDEPE